MDIRNHTHVISENQILNLSKIDSRTKNVVAGIDKHCFGVHCNETGTLFQFIYINGASLLRGYLLQLEPNHPNFYQFIIEFSFIISIEFDLQDPVNLYNSFIKDFQSALEFQNVITISNLQLKKLERETGDPFPAILAPGKIQVITYLDKVEFYKSLIGSNYPQITFNENYTYLIINLRNGLFKIGRSKNPFKREKTLQGEEPEICLIGYWRGGASLERDLHKHFSGKRVRGEWFKLSYIDLVIIKDIASNDK